MNVRYNVNFFLLFNERAAHAKYNLLELLNTIFFLFYYLFAYLIGDYSILKIFLV
jgi:hypothetical protein